MRRPAASSGRCTASRSASRTSSTSPGCRPRCGAAAFAHRQPTVATPRLVARLRAAGAVIVGKTVATQFAFKDPAPTTNPWSIDHTPGGSSSGSAAAVAARQVPAAIGTQTVGSILRPSAFCGVVGLKGAHGDVPTDGRLSAGPDARPRGPDRAVRGRRGGRPVRARGRRAASSRPRSNAAARGARRSCSRSPSPRPGRTSRAWSRRLADAGRRGRRGGDAGLVRAAGRGRSGDPRGRGGCRPRVDVPDTRRRVRAADRRPRRAPGSGARRRRPSRRPGPSGGVPRGGHPAPGRRRRAAVAGRAGSRAAARRSGTGDFALCAPWSTAGVPSIAIPTGLDDGGPAPRAPADGLPDGLRPAARGGRVVRGAGRLRRPAACDHPRVTTPLWSRSAAWLARAIAAREVSSLEAVDACLARIEDGQPADQRGRPAGRRRTGPSEAGRRGGSRAATRSARSTACRSRSRTRSTRRASSRRRAPSGWRDRVPDRDATVVARLRAAGGILLGKTNTPEFTWANETDNEVYGRTSNPYDLDRTTGRQQRRVGGDRRRRRRRRSTSAATAATASASRPTCAASRASSRPAAACRGPATGRGTRACSSRSPSWARSRVASRTSSWSCRSSPAPTGRTRTSSRRRSAIRRRSTSARLRVAWFGDNGIRTPTPETIAAVRLPPSPRSPRPGRTVEEQVPPDIADGAPGLGGGHPRGRLRLAVASHRSGRDGRPRLVRHVRLGHSPRRRARSPATR